MPFEQQADHLLRNHKKSLALAQVPTASAVRYCALLMVVIGTLTEKPSRGASRAQVITEFYLVGLLTAAATLLGGCMVLPTMARNALRSTVSQVLRVRSTLRATGVADPGSALSGAV